MYETIAYYAGPNVQFKKKLGDSGLQGEDAMNKHSRLIEQYEELIYFLKEQGAMLNNIRPHYLLAYQDFLNFQKQDGLRDQISINCQKISESQYVYLTADCWVQVFYQLMKIYQFSRISAKSLKAVLLDNPA